MTWKGYRAIANVLNDEGVPSPRNAEWAHIYSGAWTASTIWSILTNPMYVGDLVWNRRTDARFFKVSNGRATERREPYGPRLVPNPEEDWIHVEETHPGIVSRRVFDAAKPTRRRSGAPPTTCQQQEPDRDRPKPASLLEQRAQTQRPDRPGSPA